MFCNEPIVNVYEGCREYDDIPEANSFLDCYHDLAYHVTIGRRIILETAHYYISLSFDGVKISTKRDSIESLQEDGEYIESFYHTDFCDPNEPPFVCYEYTLFFGERLIEVKTIEKMFLLRFDHFQLKLIPHDIDADDVPSLCNKGLWTYNHVYGTEHLIKRTCSCGGQGELLMDFVSDYVVRCKKCNKSTYAEIDAINAIAEWEANEVHCDFPEIVIE